MPTAPLAQTQMPQFSLMGLLLGGRGYASGWFQNRDRLQMLQAQADKERADRNAFAQSVLSGPQYGQYLAHPDDRAAQWNLWGQMYGGPETAASLGNNLLTQQLGAAESRHLADLQHQYQMGETTFATDERIRAERQLAQDKLEQQGRILDYFSKPQDNSGLTAAQIQFRNNTMARQAGILPDNGFDIVLDENGQPIGQLPAVGTVERNKMEDTASAYDTLGNKTGQMLFQLDNPAQITRGGWNQTIDDLTRFVIPRAVTTGALGKEEAAQIASLFPSWKNAEFTPEFISTAREQLEVMQHDMQKRLHEYSRDTLLPLGERTGEYQAPDATPTHSLEDSPNKKRLEDLNARAKTAPYKETPAIPQDYNQYYDRPGFRQPSALETFKEQRRVLQGW